MAKTDVWDRRAARGTNAVACRTAVEIAGDRWERLRRPCPTCGELGARIVYGYPNGPLVAAGRRGQVVLGGCTHLSATHRCAQGHEWHSPDATF